VDARKRSPPRVSGFSSRIRLGDRGFWDWKFYVIEELEDTLQMFDALFKRKSFLHFYTDHGMDQMEFVDAASIMTDLIEEYKMAESDTITQ
jgi:hypothetical protein